MGPLQRQHEAMPSRHRQMLLKRCTSRRGRLGLVKSIEANNSSVDEAKSRAAILKCLNQMEFADPDKTQQVFPHMSTAELLRSLWKRVVPDRTRLECFSKVLGYGQEGIVVASRQVSFIVLLLSHLALSVACAGGLPLSHVLLV